MAASEMATDAMSQPEQSVAAPDKDAMSLRAVWQVPAFLAGMVLLGVVFLCGGAEDDGQDWRDKLSEEALALLDAGELDEAYDAAMDLLDRPDVRGSARAGAQSGLLSCPEEAARRP